MKEFYDRFENRVVVGDYVVYGNNLGRCAKTALGRVTAIFERPDRVWSGGQYTEAMVPSLQVDSLQDDVGFFRERMKVKRKVTLRETERVLKYDAKLVSPKVKRLFDAATE